MEFNYLKYKNHTIVKLIFMSIGLAIPVLMLFFILPNYEKTLGTDLKVIRWIVFAIFEVAIIWKIARYIHIICSEEYASNFYIQIHDERTVYIKQKTSTFTLKLTLYLLALAAIVAGFYNSVIFYTLLIVIAGIIISDVIIYIFYSKKF